MALELELNLEEIRWLGKHQAETLVIHFVRVYLGAVPKKETPENVRSIKQLVSDSTSEKRQRSERKQTAP
jgi:hypothetical protein